MTHPTPEDEARAFLRALVEPVAQRHRPTSGQANTNDTGPGTEHGTGAFLHNLAQQADNQPGPRSPFKRGRS